MDMDVHNGLASSRPHVHTHVIPIRMEIAIQLCLALPDQFERGFTLVLSQFEEVGHMPEGNDQQMSFADRIHIVPAVAEKILKDDFRRNRGTKRALSIHGRQQTRSSCAREHLDELGYDPQISVVLGSEFEDGVLLAVRVVRD